MKAMLHEARYTEPELAEENLGPKAGRAWSGLERTQLSVGSVASYLTMLGREDDAHEVLEIYNAIGELMNRLNAVVPGSDRYTPSGHQLPEREWYGDYIKEKKP
jgi:hypothetical protein